MGELLDAGRELVPLLACLVALALVYLATGIVKAIDAAVPNPTIGIGIGPAWKPLDFIHQAIDASLHRLADVRDGLEGSAAKFFRGVLDSLELLIGLNLLAMLLVADALTYLWHVALDAVIGKQVAPVKKTADQALAQANAAATGTTGTSARSRLYADSVASAALADAKAYAHAQVAAATAELGRRIDQITASTVPQIITKDLAAGGPIHAAITNAIRGSDFLTQAEVDRIITADLAQGGVIRQAIQSTIAKLPTATAPDVVGAIQTELAPGGAITRAIAAQLAAAVAAARPAGSTTTVTNVTQGVSADDVAQAIAQAIAGDLAPGGAIAQAIADAIPSPATLPAPGEGISLADLAAKVGTIATAVAGIAAISFIGGPECRGRVSQICETDGRAWGKLLSGAAFLTLALDFHDFVVAAETVATGIGEGVAELERPLLAALPPLPLAA